MPQATFWFALPFRDWIGQRTLTLSWEGQLTVRDLFEQLAANHPVLRTNLPREGLQQDAVNAMVAVIVDGEILSLHSEIRDGATVDVLMPLSGGLGGAEPRLPGLHRPGSGHPPIDVPAPTVIRSHEIS